MRRLGVRLFMILVGVSVLAFYLGLAALAYLVLASLWASDVDLLTTVVLLGGLSLTFGYLSYRFGTNRILADVDAARLPRERAPEAHRRLDDLSTAMAVARPTLLVANLATPNAFAIGGGRDAAVVVDRSLFRLLSADEFEALLAHELAHLQSRDSLVQTLAYSAMRTVVGVLTVLLLPALFLLTGVARGLAWIRGRPTEWLETPFGRVRYRLGQVVALAFVAMTLFVRAHSRRREFAADDRAAEVTGKPVALARALRKIQRASEPGWGLLSTLYVHGDDDGLLTRLLSTHPPMDDRIERLVEMGERAEAARWHRVEVQ
jgi:heat shock protein HtpX